MHDRSRRALLHTAARGLAAGTAAGLAGCSGLPDPARSGPVGDVAAPARGPAGYRNLVPAEPPGDPPLLAVSRVDVSALDRPWLSPGTTADLLTAARRGRDYLGLAREAVDAVTWIDFDVAVVRGGFSRASVGRTLRRGGYEPAGDHGGFAVFEHPDDARSAAVGPETIVWTDASVPASYATRVVDAARGRVPRLAESDEAFRRVSGSLGTGTLTTVAPAAGQSRGEEGPLPGRIAFGQARTFTADATYVTRLILFEDVPPTVERVREAMRERGTLEAYRRVEVTRGERTVRVDGLVADDAGDDRGPRPPVVPRITFGFDRDADAGTVTVTHEAGDHALARRLTVEALGETDRQFGDRYATVSPGDSLTVEPEATSGSLRVMWSSGPDHRLPVGQFPLSPDDGRRR